MSTRSNIAMELPNGKYKVIYCHFDGYLDHNGRILLEHYNTRERVEKLLELGNLSSIAEKLEPDPTKSHGHGIGIRQEDVCVSYARDYQENEEQGLKEDQSAIVMSKKKMLESPWIEYFYIFTLDDKWKFYDWKHEELKDVKEELEKEKYGLKEDATDQFSKVGQDCLKKAKKKHHSDEEM